MNTPHKAQQRLTNKQQDRVEITLRCIRTWAKFASDHKGTSEPLRTLRRIAAACDEILDEVEY